MTATPDNSTVISNLPNASAVNAGDTILTQRSDKSLVNMPAELLKGRKGDTGETGPAGKDGVNGKDATAPPLAILPYYGDTAPDGWFLLQGQTFDPATYPILGKKFPNNTLPDFRNRVPRGAGSLIGLGDTQDDALQNITGSCWLDGGATGYSAPSPDGGAFYTERGTGHRLFQTYQGNTAAQNQMTFDASLVVRTSDETRVKAIGVNFIIKAA